MDKINKELEHQKMVPTKENQSLKAMYNEKKNLCRVLQQELEVCKGKLEVSKTSVITEPLESIPDSVLKSHRENPEK